MSENKNIPKGWIETTLGEVTEIRNGGTPSTRNSEYWNGDIPWLTPKDLSNYKNVYINKGERNITKKGLENSSANLLPRNTILFTSRAPIGYVAIAKNELTTNQGFKNIICDEEKSHYKYFYYLLKLKSRFIEKLASGSTFKEASTSLMKSYKITIPQSIPEQKAIAAVLTAFDDKIELLQEQNRTLEAIAQTIFKEWFGKYKPGDELPEGWREGKLGDLVNHIKENVKPFEFPEKTYKHYSIPAYDDGLKPILEKGHLIKSNKYLVKENSFLVSKLNPFTPRVWTIFNAEDNHICSTEFQVLQPKISFYFSFLHSFLNSKYYTRNISISIQGTSSSHQRVRPDDILNIELIIPDNDTMYNFEERIGVLIRKKDENHLQILTLQQTRDTLLPKLMSGEIRVDEIKWNAV